MGTMSLSWVGQPSAWRREPLNPTFQGRALGCCPTLCHSSPTVLCVRQPYFQGRVEAAVQPGLDFQCQLWELTLIFSSFPSLHPSGFFPLLSQVVLPQRKFQLHRLKLSEEEETVYSVLFARSRWVPGRSIFSHVLLLFCPWLGSGSRVKSSQTVFMELLIRRMSVPFL